MIPVTVLCSTIGRRSLVKTVESFKSQTHESGDRMIILGDGWERPWVRELEGDGVEFRKCPKSEFYGHSNVCGAIKDVTTPYWTWIGDDDLYLPGSFSRMREWMSTKCVLVTETLKPDGRFCSALRDRGSSKGQIGIAGWQAWVPRWMEISDFSTKADTDLFDELLIKHTHLNFRFLHSCPTVFIRFPETSREVWEKIGAGDMFPWEEGMWGWRRPDWDGLSQ